MIVLDEQTEQRVPYNPAGFTAFWLQTGESHTIPAYMMQVPGAQYTVLFSHANATDIGQMRQLLHDLATSLTVNVMAYEYTGYGETDLKPQEKSTYSDIMAAYNHLLYIRQILPSNIIAYGQSLGSGPTIKLASEHAVGGVVLHSAMMSGLRVARGKTGTGGSWWFDIYPNIDRITKVTCPVLCIHGCVDTEVPVSHGIELSRAAVESFPPLWLNNAAHNDIETKCRAAYLEKLHEFLQFLSQRQVPRYVPDDAPRSMGCGFFG